MKQKINALWAVLLGVAFAAYLAACGGNSDDTTPPAPPAPPTVLTQTSFEGSFEPFGVYQDPPETSKSFITIVTDPTAPDGNSVARISYEPGVRDGMYVGGIFFDFPDDAQPTELWGQFYMKTSPNYVWHSTGNKLVYMRMGYQNPVDGTSQTDHILGINYSYWSGYEEIFAPNIGWATQQSTNSDLNQMIYSSVGEFTRDTWHKIVFHLEMNTPGQQNGIGRIWLNDELVVNASNIMWLNAGNWGGVSGFRITPLWGGGGPDVIEETQYMYFDDVILQTGPFSGYSD
ncbi:MAG: hypothetical protein LBE15_01065 [Burkholderiales bacterium]|jgi:hypothetical protein|nr:hypothetical protein [Burkholderiales bacterium]